MSLVQYDKQFTCKNNWQIYFGFVRKYTLIYSKCEWEQWCKLKGVPEFYKKLTQFTLTENINISIPENKEK